MAGISISEAELLELVASRGSMSSVDALQTQWVRYFANDEATVADAWRNEISKTGYEQWLESSRQQISPLPAQESLHSQLPESISLSLVQAPAEYTLPVKQDKRLTPSFKVRVKVGYKGEMRPLRLAVKALLVTASEMDEIQYWTEESYHSDVNKRKITELKGQTIIQHPLGDFSPKKLLDPEHGLENALGYISISGSSGEGTLKFIPGSQFIPGSLGIYPGEGSLKFVEGRGAQGMVLQADPSFANRDLPLATWMAGPSLMPFTGGVQPNALPPSNEVQTSFGADDGTLPKPQTGDAFWSNGSNGFTRMLENERILESSNPVDLGEMYAMLGLDPSLAAQHVAQQQQLSKQMVEDGALPSSVPPSSQGIPGAAPASAPGPIGGPINIQARGPVGPSNPTGDLRAAAQLQLKMMERDYEFTNVEFVRATRMTKMDQIILTYNIPTIGICRAEQREKACQQLGVPFPPPSLTQRTDETYSAPLPSLSPLSMYPQGQVTSSGSNSEGRDSRGSMSGRKRESPWGTRTTDSPHRLSQGPFGSDGGVISAGQVPQVFQGPDHDREEEGLELPNELLQPTR